MSSSALAESQYVGTTLDWKQIALTFDDGPGTRTLELSAYLKDEGIQAVFFVVGTAVSSHSAVVAQIAADGHLVANHTQNHLDLTSTAFFPLGQAGDARIVSALADADALIAPYVSHGRFLFRAPFGAWNDRDYAVLHSSAMDKYVGPIRWDIGGQRTSTTAADWACWQEAPTLTTKACGDLYLSEIGIVGRGISLMHDVDNGDIDNHSLTGGVGNTVDMVKYLAPILKTRGYTFVRADAVPAIDADLPPWQQPVDAGADASVEAEAGATADAGSVDAGPAVDAADDGDLTPDATGPSPPASGVAPSPASPAPANPCVVGTSKRQARAH
mgnify:CR=1 FL=1